ncbi:MAG: response regulator [candidate division Zixibacteria bacterium]
MLIDKNIEDLAPDIVCSSVKATETRQEALRILIVDDDEQVIETLSKALEIIDVSTEIKTSLTGEGALKLLEFNSFDLVILDVNLPDIDGGDVLRFVRTQAKNATAKIIAISGVPNVLDSMLQLGADVSLSKPFKLCELTDNIKKLVNT